MRDITITLSIYHSYDDNNTQYRWSDNDTFSHDHIDNNMSDDEKNTFRDILQQCIEQLN